MNRLMIAACLLVIAFAANARGAEELRVSPELERCVARGLDYLMKTQNANGAWSDQYGEVSGVVGLAMLTFMAHGELADEGKYGGTIHRAADYILRSQESNGLLARGGSPMYSHGFATLAMGELYGQMNDPRIGLAMKRATGLIVSCQNAQGGWRYSVGSTDSDTTVSGAQMMALRAAANAGMEVPMSTIKKGNAYYKSCFVNGGGFGYTGRDGANQPRAGIGLLVLSLSGEYHCAETKATADYLLATPSNRESESYFYYSMYYCSQAMFQAGGKYWRYWNDVMTPAIMAMQKPDGSWTGANGPTCDTAMALLAIEINYGLLPIYQR
jgi:prenyltransferase beta subunit